MICNRGGPWPRTKSRQRTGGSIVVACVAVIGIGTVAEKAKSIGEFLHGKADGTSSASSAPPAAAPNPSSSPSSMPFVMTTIPKPSREMPSGACGAYSGWYELCSDSQPADWRIAASSFELSGNRACTTGFAECKKTVDTPAKICYEFRLQGHNEECGHSGNTGIQYSTGHLSVTWQHH
jgi:hypothetical protein